MLTPLIDALRWTACAAVTPPLLGPATALGPVAPAVAGRLFAVWALVARRIFGLELTVEDHNGGRYDGGGPYLFVLLNQSSLCETFILPPLLPPPYAILMNLGYAALPFIGWSQLALGGVAIVRQWPAQGRRALDQARRRLAAGGTWAISIEGRRSPDGALGPYKKGPAVLAIQAGATIVPLVIHGAHERMPLGSWRIRPGRVHAVMLPAIPTRGLTLADRDALVEQLRALAERELARRSA